MGIACEKKISIILPVYNGEKYIERTLRNILKSVYKNIEIIIVNDGSKDASLSICNRMAQGDKRIAVYTKQNGGVASARNYGVLKATGEFLCFCDQDDIVNAECYIKQVCRMEADGSDICICGIGRDIGGEVSLYEDWEDQCYTKDKILEHILYPLLFQGFSVPIKMKERNSYSNIWSCMFRMSFWRKYNFQFRAYINYEDDLLVKLDALSRAERVSTIAYVGYCWRMNLRSQTYAGNFVEDMELKQQKCYEDMEQCIRRCVDDKEVLGLFKRAVFCKQYLDAIHNLAHQKKGMSYIKGYYRRTIYQRDFADSIEMKKFVRKGMIRLKVLLPLLAGHFTVLSYLAEHVLDCLLRISLRFQLLTKLERRMKAE